MPLGAFKAALMGTAGVSSEDVVLLSSNTHSNVSAVSFTSGLTSAYKEYIFAIYMLNPATAGANLGFKASVDGGSNYGVATTTTSFYTYHKENSDNPTLGYVGGDDEAQATGLINLSGGMHADADQGCTLIMYLFDPASTVYAKQFTAIWQGASNDSPPYAVTQYFGGYVNTTSAVNAMQFAMSSGNLDAKVKLWGVK